MELYIELTTNIYFYLSVIFIILIVLFNFIKAIKKKNTNNTIMSMQYTEYMKGLMAILILFNHFAIRIDNLGVFKILNNIGFPAVTVFLFISGYIEAYQLEKKGKDYSINFLQRKICRIYVPWLLSAILFIVVFKICDFGKILEGLFLFRTVYRLDTFNWFLIYLLVCYLLIFIYLKLFGSKNNFKIDKSYYIINFIGSAIWLLICVLLNKGANWYVNSFAFFIGTIFCKYRDNILNLSEKKKNKLLLLNSLLFGCMYILQYAFDNEFLVNFIRIISCMFCAYIVFILSSKVELKSKIINFCGKISLEIFLVGTGIFVFYYSKFPNDGHAIPLIIFFVILTSYILQFVSSLIIKKITKNKTNISKK